MKNAGFLILVLASGLGASAFAKDTFVKFSDLNQAVQLKYEKAHKAQFKIRVSEGVRCTGTYISNNGHGLTAAHCIKNCMPWPSSQGLKKWSVDLDVHVPGVKVKHSEIKVIANPWIYPQVCDAVIDGEKIKIKVLAGPKGRFEEQLPKSVVNFFKQYYWITDAEVNGYKAHWLDSFYKGWGMGGDFAIFKFIKPKEKKTSCLKISEADSFSGDHYVLSYPGKTSLNAKEKNDDLYLSKGDVHQGNYFGSEAIEINDTEYRYLNSNLWAFPGSSGASLVNPKDHSISGVLSAVVGEQGIKGSELPDARFVSAKLIREQAGEVLEKISCD